MFTKQPAWGNAAGAQGRRMTEDEPVAKAYYDPEDRRQRRLGMGQAGLSLAGAAALGEGGRRIHADTKAIRHISTVQDGRKAKMHAGRASGVVRLRKRPAALAAGGAAALGGAAAVRRFAESETGRKWD